MYSGLSCCGSVSMQGGILCSLFNNLFSKKKECFFSKHFHHKFICTDLYPILTGAISFLKPRYHLCVQGRSQDFCKGGGKSATLF